MSINVPKPAAENPPDTRPDGGVVTADQGGKFEDTFKKANDQDQVSQEDQVGAPCAGRVCSSGSAAFVPVTVSA